MMKKVDEIREYLENYGTSHSTEMDSLFGLFKSDVANMATKYRKGELYVDDAETAIEDLQPRLEENEELNERLALIKANPDKVFITDSDDNFMMI